MTITRRIQLGYAGLLVLMLVLAGMGVGLAIWIDTWSSDQKDSLAQAQAAATISEASANMVIYGSGELFSNGGANGTQYESLRQEDRAEVMGAIATLARHGDGQWGTVWGRHHQNRVQPVGSGVERGDHAEQHRPHPGPRKTSPPP